MHTLKLTREPVVCAGAIQGTRARQEDYYFIGQKDGRTIAVVCDGMGGMRGGNVASRLAAEQMAEDLAKVRLTENMHCFWKRELERLDDKIFGLRGSDSSRLGAGTTIVAVLLQGANLHWFSVGDSRIYYMREHRLYCVTREHNYAVFGKQSADMNERGKQLVSYLGMGVAELFDGSNTSFQTKQGDRLLLCTDGLFRVLGQEEIAEILDSGEKLQAVRNGFAEALEAKRRQEQDNATWVVIEV